MSDSDSVSNVPKLPNYLELEASIKSDSTSLQELTEISLTLLKSYNNQSLGKSDKAVVIRSLVAILEKNGDFSSKFAKYLFKISSTYSSINDTTLLIEWNIKLLLTSVKAHNCSDETLKLFLSALILNLENLSCLNQLNVHSKARFERLNSFIIKDLVHFSKTIISLDGSLLDKILNILLHPTASNPNGNLILAGLFLSTINISAEIKASFLKSYIDVCYTNAKATLHNYSLSIFNNSFTAKVLSDEEIISVLSNLEKMVLKNSELAFDKLSVELFHSLSLINYNSVDLVCKSPKFLTQLITGSKSSKTSVKVGSIKTLHYILQSKSSDTSDESLKKIISETFKLLGTTTVTQEEKLEILNAISVIERSEVASKAVTTGLLPLIKRDSNEVYLTALINTYLRFINDSSDPIFELAKSELSSKNKKQNLRKCWFNSIILQLQNNKHDSNLDGFFPILDTECLQVLEECSNSPLPSLVNKLVTAAYSSIVYLLSISKNILKDDTKLTELLNKAASSLNILTNYRIYTKFTTYDENYWFSQSIYEFSRSENTSSVNDDLSIKEFGYSLLFLNSSDLITSYKNTQLNIGLLSKAYVSNYQFVSKCLVTAFTDYLLNFPASELATLDLNSNNFKKILLLSGLSSIEDKEFLSHLLIDYLTISHHALTLSNDNKNQNLWISMCLHCGIDPNQLVFIHAKQIVDKLSNVLLKADGQSHSSGYYDATVSAISTVAFVNHDAVIPLLLEIFANDLNPEHVTKDINDFKLRVWKAEEGELVEDVDTKSKSDDLDKNSKDYETLKWEKSVRKDLANKKTGKANEKVKLSKEELVKLNEKLEQQSAIRATLNQNYNALRRSLEISSKLASNAKLFDNGSDTWFPFAVNYIFQIFNSNDCMQLVKSLAIESFISLSNVLDFSFSQSIAINTLRLFNVVDDSNDYKLNDSQSLNSVLSSLLFGLKIASDKTTFNSTVLIYILPLLIKVAELGKSHVLKTKGKRSAVIIKTEFVDEDPEEELLTLVLEILSSNAETFQNDKIQRTSILEILLSLMTIPSKSKLAKDCFMSLIQNISINLSNADLLLIISKLIDPVKFVRTAILEALDSEFDLANDYENLSTSIPPELYIAVFDNEETNAQLASTIWQESLFDLSNDEQMPYKLSTYLGTKDNGIRLSIAKALASSVEVLSKSNPELFSTILTNLLDLYSLKRKPPPPIRDAFGLIMKSSLEQPDTWEERSGVALAVELMCDLFTSETDVESLFRFLVLEEKAFGDAEFHVRQELTSAALKIVNLQGAKFVEVLIPIFEEGLAAKDDGSKEQDHIKESTIIVYGALARHLSSSDQRLEKITKRLLKTLDTPSEDVQFAISNCLAPLVAKIDDHKKISEYYDDLFNKLFTGAKLAYRRGAAYGISGLVKGGGIKSLVENDIIRNLTDASDDKKDPKKREGVSFTFECLSQSLGALFEPYVIEILPIVLKNLGDQVPEVREATDYSTRTIMKHTTSYGIKKLIPLAIENLDDISWRSKKGSVDLLGSMAYLDPTQLSANLPTIVPEIVKVLNDSHKEVRKAADQALKRFGEVIRNPEIQLLVPTLLKAIGDPTKYTTEALDELIKTQFVHYIDGPSLALIIHVIHRGMHDRSALTKRKACQIVGNMSILVDSKDLIPYLPQLISELEIAMVDPVPTTRATASRALGSLVEKLGEERFPDLIPRLLATLQDQSKAGDRIGSAQALAEVISGLGLSKLDELLPTILAGTRSKQSFIRAGFMPLLLFLPVCFGTQFSPYLASTIPPILNGLADTDEEIRDTALRSGRLIVNNYAKKAVDLLLPELEIGLSDSSPRIRLSSVELTGELLFKISGISGKQELTDDLTTLSNNVNKVFDEVLGVERRDRILASLFMCRSDTTGTVRVASINIWKALVANTPKTVKEILPTLTQIIIRRLASSDETQRTIAAQTLGEMVRRVGANALAQLLPTLEESLVTSDSDAKQGICIAARELIESSSADAIVEYQDIFVNIIRDALVDANPAVREAAALAFDVLQDAIGNSAIDEVIPQLLEMLGSNEDKSSSDNALSALEEIMATKADVIFPILIPSLLTPPINAKALGALAQVAGSALYKRLSTIINTLIESVNACDPQSKEKADLIDALGSVLLSVESDEGCHPLMQQILSTMRHEDAESVAIIYEVLPKFFDATTLDYSVYTQDLVAQCILSLDDSDKTVAKNAFETLSVLIKRQPKDSLERLVRPAQQTLSMIGKPNEDLYVFTLPKGPNCILPIFLHGLMYGTSELREISANGISDIIDRTPSDGLKPFITVIVGPLIRVIGERFSSDVKSAVLLALNKLFSKIPQFLRPFIPQLQRTFVKSLSDPHNDVLRSRAARALGTLIEYQPRVDPLVTELLTGAKQATGEENLGVKTAMLKALLEVVSKAGSKMSEASKEGVMALVEQEMFSTEVGVDTAVAYARLVGALSTILKKEEAIKMLKNKVLDADMEDSNSSRFAILTINAFLKDSPQHIFESGIFSEICSFIVSSGKSKMPYVSDNATIASGKLLLSLPKFDSCIEDNKESISELVKSLGVLMCAPASNSLDTRRLSLVVVRTACRFAYDSAIKPEIDTLGPAVFSCVRDPIIPIKLAAEKAFLAIFNLVEDIESQYFQQWIEGKQKEGSTIDTITGTTLQIRSVSEYVKRVASRLANLERERIESGGDEEAMFSDRFEDESEIWAIGGVELSKE